MEYRGRHGKGHFWSVWLIEKHCKAAKSIGFGGLGKTLSCAKRVDHLYIVSVLLHKEVHFRGHDEAAAHSGGHVPKNPFWGVIRHF